ncbi:hypothetical protein HZQ67_13890 [Elizabethkingia anophelis]|nr:hypothetical protein [Elizabethkingia anophelis]
MGVFTYVPDYQEENYLWVLDHDVNGIFQEAKNLDDTLLIHEVIILRNRFLRKPIIEKTYSIYHKCKDKEGKYYGEVQQMLCATGSREVVITYLYGIINGCLHSKNI